MKYLPYVLTLTNFLIVLVLILYETVLESVFALIGGTGFTLSSCFRSWANASLNHKELLLVSVQQTFVFSMLILVAMTVNPSGAKPQVVPARIVSFGKVMGGLLVMAIWLCWMGSQTPIDSLDDVGFISRRLFNKEVGILLAILLPNFLAIEIGKNSQLLFAKH